MDSEIAAVYDAERRQQKYTMPQIEPRKNVVNVVVNMKTMQSEGEVDDNDKHGLVKGLDENMQEHHKNMTLTALGVTCNRSKVRYVAHWYCYTPATDTAELSHNPKHFISSFGAR